MQFKKIYFFQQVFPLFIKVEFLSKKTKIFFPIDITLMEMLILFTQIELNLKAYANNLILSHSF